MTYELYIGSNNKTGKLELAKIQNTLNKYFAGYTLILGDGAWQGRNEKMVIVKIATDEDALIYKAINALKNSVKQDAIGLSRIPEIEFI